MDPKPVAGVETPASDDIITPCAGGCGGWMVTQHPRHILGGCDMDEETGEMRRWSPTPEWVEAEAERLGRGGRSCLACGPRHLSDEEIAEREADDERIKGLRDAAR
jgi:hypothetical protein